MYGAFRVENRAVFVWNPEALQQKGGMGSGSTMMVTPLRHNGANPHSIMGRTRIPLCQVPNPMWHICQKGYDIMEHGR
jgi:hypothetical protein